MAERNSARDDVHLERDRVGEDPRLVVVEAAVVLVPRERADPQDGPPVVIPRCWETSVGARIAWMTRRAPVMT